ncbi:MAG: hypothetical protein R3B69_00360 [Candidatus Paceibacterota bacterium]
MWQFGDGSGSNNGTYLSFMPWYSNGTRGYHYFGVTSGGDYAFTRDNSIWHHFTTIGRAASGESNQIYEDNILRDSVTQLGSSRKSNQHRTQDWTLPELVPIWILKWMNCVSLLLQLMRRAAEFTNLTDQANFISTSTTPTERFNVAVVGAPTTYWRFSQGNDTLYGESFDSDDGDPGSVQWDDSSFSITISGVVYADDGVTPMSAPVCNGSTDVVKIALDNVVSYVTPCDPRDGTYEVPALPIPVNLK